VEQFSEFVSNNLILFAALVGILAMLIKVELDNQVNKGRLLSATMAIRLMNNHDDALIIDIRSVSEYKKGHIKGAQNMPLSGFSASLGDYGKFKDKSVLVYCNSGRTAISALKMLKKAGFEDFYNLEGGIAAWIEANMPLSKK